MSNRIRNTCLVLLAVTFLVLLAAFAASAASTRNLARRLEPDHAGGPAPIRVVFISQVQNNPFWRSIEQGARASAGRYGMDVEYAGPLRIDAAEQSRLLEKAIAAGAGALIVQGLDDPVYAKLIDQAAAQGIPTVTVDADEPDSKRIAYVGTDNRRAGASMGELVVRTIGTAGRIGALLGSEANNQRLRLEGFRSVVNRYPGLSVVDVRYSNVSRVQAAQQAEAMLRKDPGLKAIVGFSALDGLGIAEAAGRAGNARVRVFAFDDLEYTRQAIRAGRITATIVQEPYGMGEEAVALLHAALQGDNADPIHYTDTSVLDRASLGTSGLNGADGGSRE
ncbi:substrate-binding domain-containing protein [Cohnella caldifontis]|uniref:substrate-binding domain-containing protein n=1 Tax=Cohnella caldifontis TaxID=3027471 RepID=UPI0023ED3941|nr:substrate-binding domain-containing protein [Cohnella sp. YIM B05605]